MSEVYGLRAFAREDEGKPIALRDGREAFVQAVYPDGTGEFAGVVGPRLPAGGAVVHRSDVRFLSHGADWTLNGRGEVAFSESAKKRWLRGAKGDPEALVAVFRGHGGDVPRALAAMDARREGGRVE